MLNEVTHETEGQVALRLACVPPPPKMAAKEIARRMRVTRQAISQWVRGVTRPNPKQWKKLARLLEIPETAWDRPVTATPNAEAA